MEYDYIDPRTLRHAVSLLAPAMLLGGLFALVPVVIHLFNRPRFSAERWGADMFLRSAVSARAGSLRFRRILLLALRALFFLVMALALARPVFRGEFVSGGDRPTAHVVIMDGSYSMRQGQGLDNAFLRARKAALSLVEGMGGADSMTLVWAEGRPRQLFAEPSFDRALLGDGLKGLAPGAGQADFPRAMEQALLALSSSAQPRQCVHVLTDLQRHGWRLDREEVWEYIRKHREALKIKPAVYVLDVAPGEPPHNFSVASIRPRFPVVEARRPQGFAVEIVNHGVRRAELGVAFLVDGAVRAERKVVVEPGSRTVDFEVTFAEPGPHYVAARTDGDDLPLDNEACLALEVRDEIPVLLIEGRSGAGLFSSDGGLLELALQSAAMPGEKSLIRVDRIGCFEMEDNAFAGLQKYRTVVLADVPAFSRYFQFALEQFVERGGGLFVLLGSKAEPAAYRRLYGDGKGLLAARMIKREDITGAPLPPVFPAGKGAFMLDVFDLSRTRVLEDVAVRTYYRTRLAKDAVPVATIGDWPLLAYKKYGKGRSALFTTSPDASWTNFPLTRDFLPLVQNLVVYLSAAVEPPIVLSQGETLAYSVPASGRTPGPAPTLIAPDKVERPLSMGFEGDSWVARWADTTCPGLYTLRLGGKSRYYAVELPRGEGDLSRLEKSERARISAFTGARFFDADADPAKAMKGDAGLSEGWRGLVLLALALLALETRLSWSFSS